jgi:hypothetical protein
LSARNSNANDKESHFGTECDEINNSTFRLLLCEIAPSTVVSGNALTIVKSHALLVASDRGKAFCEKLLNANSAINMAAPFSFIPLVSTGDLIVLFSPVN